MRAISRSVNVISKSIDQHRCTDDLVMWCNGPLLKYLIRPEYQNSLLFYLLVELYSREISMSLHIPLPFRCNYFLIHLDFIDFALDMYWSMTRCPCLRIMNRILIKSNLTKHSQDVRQKTQPTYVWSQRSRS